MSILDRLRQSWDVFRGVKTAYEVIPTWEVGRPTYTQPEFAEFVRSGYRKNELIYACISLKADTAALPVIGIYNKRTGEKLVDHPLARVISQPNPHMSSFDFFSATIIFLHLAGNAYWEKVRSRAGQVVQLWPLRPDRVGVVWGESNVIQGYTYRVSEVGIEVTLDPRDILHFKMFDPIGIYQGLAPVQVAARVGDVDNSTTDFVKLFFEQGGMPPGLLTTKQKLTDTDVADIRRRWVERYGGFRRWTVPAVLDADASYQRTGMTFQEMGIEELDSRAEARICMVLRVPPILIGAKVGLNRSTFSNYAEARRSFWEDSMAPLYRRLADELNSDLAAEFSDDIEFRWDFSNVPALQEDRQQVWERSRAALAAGGITVNEFREAVGLPRVPQGDVFLRTMAMVEVPVSRGGKRGQKRASPPPLAQREELEREMIRELSEFFGRQRDAVVEAVRGVGT